jgi:site-specific DNA-methyltransferase (adenine-specific)
VEVKGGVCYFLWSDAYNGDCAVTSVRDGVKTGPEARDLGEFDVLVRDARSLAILRKVLEQQEPSIIEILSVDKEFGWTSNFTEFQSSPEVGSVPLHYVKQGKRLVGHISRSKITKSVELVDTWKVMVPQAGSDGGQRIPDVVLGKPFIASAPSVCTQTFLFFSVQDKEKAESLESYLSTRFFRFLVSLRKITQHATRSTYTWVPQQTWDRVWTDADLYAKYKITKTEVEFIEKMIRPMDLSDE